MENMNKAEAMLNQYKPLLKKWEFKFYKHIGLPTSEKALKAFAKVYTSSEKHFDAPCAFALCGAVYGHSNSRFPDGEVIVTSDVKTIDLVEWAPAKEEWFTGKYSLEDVAAFTENKLFCATTESGSKYYFLDKDPNAYMFAYMAHAIHCA